MVPEPSKHVIMKIQWNFACLRHLYRVYLRCGCTVRKAVLLILCLIGGGGYILSKWNMVCSNWEITAVLDDLCADVEEGRALGTLCKEICMKNTLVPQQCQAFHGGKEVVFRALFHDIPVYVKGRRSISRDNDENLFWKDEEGNEHFPTLPEFKEIMKNHLYHNYNVSFTEKTFFKLWSQPLNRDNFSTEQNNLLLKLSLETLWNLSQDQEFVFLSLFEHTDIFPELYGYCGGLYIVEEVTPLDFPSLIERQSFNSWARRAKIALKILEFAEKLDTGFDSPVHLCDVKPEHFGLSDNSKVKFNDADNIYLKPVVDRTVGDGSHCAKHSDCDLFDCKGQCDLIRQKCSGRGVSNNNLQVICQKIFLGKSYGFKSLGGTGLLASRHGEKVVKPLLEACANPSAAKDDVRLRADSSHLKSIRKALEDIIQADQQMAK